MEEEKKEQAIKNNEPVVENNLPENSVASEDDNIASAEDLQHFAEERRRRRAEKKKPEKADDETDIFGEYHAPESSIDPYLEPDPQLPWVQYKEHPFLSRGCRSCPEAYVPIEEKEVRSCSKVTSCNWLKGIRQPFQQPFDIVEVRFKNNRKEFYRLPEGLEVTEGDIVAVEGAPGHDVGVVSLTGEVCRLQMKKRRVEPDSENVRKLFRRAKASDIERWAEAIQEELTAVSRTRRIANGLGLEMKINDVEIQADHGKAIFYYTADDRVDFRTLIKVLADEFKVRVEMKQIGVRQEAGKIGGLGTCGRELCCCTWLTNYKSVTTSAAKTQQILPNPQKLAGQCGKLKCCLNFENEVYADALKKFPPANTPIRFQKGLALYKKTDPLRGIMWYAYEGESDLYAIPAESVKQVIEMNRNQQYPEKLEDFQIELMSTSVLTQETSNPEFEQELRRMADSSNDTIDNDENTSRREERRDNRKRDSRDNKPRESRDNKPRENRSKEPRDNRDNHHNDNRRREHRDNKDNKRNEHHNSNDNRNENK